MFGLDDSESKIPVILEKPEVSSFCGEIRSASFRFSSEWLSFSAIFGSRIVQLLATVPSAVAQFGPQCRRFC